MAGADEVEATRLTVSTCTSVLSLPPSSAAVPLLSFLLFFFFSFFFNASSAVDASNAGTGAAMTAANTSCGIPAGCGTVSTARALAEVSSIALASFDFFDFLVFSLGAAAASADVVPSGPPVAASPSLRFRFLLFSVVAVSAVVADAGACPVVAIEPSSFS